jgi:hypothetical protein
MARRTALDRALAPARAELERAGVPSPARFTPFFDLLPLPHRFGLEEARVLLVTLGGGPREWMLHPAVEPLPGEAGTALGRLRPAEHALLLSPALPELIAALGFRLGTYAELAASRARAAA